MRVYACVHACLSTYEIQKSLKGTLKGILGQGSEKGREGWRKMRERERQRAKETERNRERWAWKEKVSSALTSVAHDANR